MSFKMYLSGDWKKATAVSKWYGNRAKMNAAISAFLLREAEVMRKLVIQGFIRQGLSTPWRKLSPWTLAARRLKNFSGTKALIHSAEMMKSVTTSISADGMTAFCGILYQARRSDGQSMVNIAKIHEFGFGPKAIRVTPKMAKYIGLLLRYMPEKRAKRRIRKASGGMFILVIPPRPFFGPARPIFMQGAEKRMMAFFSKHAPRKG